MRKILAAAALGGSMAVTGLAVAPAAQAANVTATATVGAGQATSSMGKWGKFYSSNKKAYTYGKTYKSGGKVYTHWYGKEFTPKYGYVWFRYYSGGKWHKFYKKWNGQHHGLWSGKGIKKVYTYTCWGGKSKYCGSVHRIY